MTSSAHWSFAIVAIGLSLTASFGAMAQTPPSPAAVACRDPRPQVCPQVYQPVCGRKRDGKTQTFGNGCSACADAEVVVHLPGPCR